MDDAPTGPPAQPPTEAGPRRTRRRGRPPLDVLFVDDDLIVVVKPSGHIVHAGPAPDAQVAMKCVRDQLGAWVYPVHRLDRATSGALCFARSSEMARELQALWQAGRVDKRYLALTRGIPPGEGLIDNPVPKRDRDPSSRVPAVSRLRRLGLCRRPRPMALVEVAPSTGRRHQIRRHLKHIDHPILGDVRYGRGEVNRMVRERFELHRLALHAHRLSFPHPRTGEWVRARAPVPADLASAMDAMGVIPAGLALDALPPWPDVDDAVAAGHGLDGGHDDGAPEDAQAAQPEPAAPARGGSS